MRRNSTVIRVLRLRRRLYGLAYCPSPRALAKEFSVTERTMYRDLDALAEAGEPVPRRAKNDNAALGGRGPSAQAKP